jgi:hypothetical protein
MLSQTRRSALRLLAVVAICRIPPQSLESRAIAKIGTIATGYYPVLPSLRSLFVDFHGAPSYMEEPPKTQLSQ